MLCFGMNLYLMNNYGGKLPMVLLCNENEEQVMQGNSSLTAEYQPYIDVLEREADKISAYTTGYGNASICYIDVTGDEKPELLFMTENSETGGGDLNIYTIENGKEKQICFLENLNIPVAGGTEYCVFRKKDDFRLYAISETYDGNGTLRSYACDEMEFAYRHSIIDADKIVVGVGLTLEHGDKTAILDRMNELAEARRSKQPLEYPSAGSTFKRPEGYFAAKLIDDSGLRGYRVGGAMVSEKHCGFVVNVEQASSADVLAVMQHVQEVVNEKYGVMLEPEVRIIR